MTGSLRRLQATALLSVSLGSVYALGASSRYTAPAYQGVKDIMPIRAWGCLLAVGGLLLFACLLRYTHPAVISTVACLVAGIYGAWGGGFLMSAIQDHRASYAGPIIFGYLAFLHINLAYSSSGEIRRG